jgi:hypothetical protein
MERDVEVLHEAQDRRRDLAVDDAKRAVLAKMREDSERVFYRQQLEVILESDFFHWITGKALNELEAEGRLRADLIAATDATKIKVYRLPGNRYWKRGALALAATVRRFAEGSLVTALGHHGELMVDHAFACAGFTIAAENVSRVDGRRWEDTEHELDRIYTRDGVLFGAEIKNTLKYIPREELEIKLAMCQMFGVVPLFIARMLPKDYINRVVRAGGFCLVLKWQMYPFGFEDLARQIRYELDLPVDCPRRLQAGTAQRLVNWHQRRLQKLGGV